MTDHKQLTMFHEDRRISEREMLKKILDAKGVCSVAIHDEPYPYIVPMNFGYEWDEKLVLYLHMAVKGHRLELLRKNPHVAINVSSWLDRVGHAPYRKETHDYRSLTVFGSAEIISSEDNEEVFMRGMLLLCAHNDRPGFEGAIRSRIHRLLLLKVPADIVTGKSQYPVSTAEEVPIPPNFD